MTGSIGFILLPGAGLGSWIWKDLQPQLHLPSLAVDYPEHDHLKVSPHIGLNAYTAHVSQQVSKWDCERLIIVAHSIGGVVGLKLAQELGKKRLAGFVAVSAAIPEHGRSYISTLPLLQRFFMPLLLRFAGTKPPEKAIREGYCNDLPNDRAGEVVKRFVAESPQLYLDNCHAEVPGGKKIYIETSADLAAPLKVQNKMAHNLDAQRLITMRSGHLPMLSYPKELAGHLNEFSDAA